MRHNVHALSDDGFSTHITSLLVHTQPGRTKDLAAHLGALKDVDIHTADESGKLVALMETRSLGRVTDLIDQINAMDGVVGATLVYHQIEDSEALDLPVGAAHREQRKEPAA